MRYKKTTKSVINYLLIYCINDCFIIDTILKLTEKKA